MSEGGVNFDFFDDPAPANKEQVIAQIVGDPHTIVWLWALLKVLGCTILWILFASQWLREWLWSRSPDLRHALEILRLSPHFINIKK